MTLMNNLLLAQYEKWIEYDYYGHLMNSEDESSIRKLIEVFATDQGVIEIAGVDGRPTVSPPLRDLSQTFSQFLQLSVSVDPRFSIPMQDFVRGICCEAPLGTLVQFALDDAGKAEAQKAMQEIGQKNLRSFLDMLGQPHGRAPYVALLYDKLIEKLGGRTLMSFFLKTRSPEGFYSWNPGMASGEGKALKTHRQEIGGKSLTVSVSRYEETGGPITSYEWNATLADAAGAIDAAACGMVYVFDREDGLPLGDLSDLIEASDAVADIDILQTNAFRKQHGDAREIIQSSDLCFVSLWERRAEADKGCGKILLDAAIANLRKRFKKVQTIIIESTPAQFAVWGKGLDPAMVESAKQDALDMLSSCISELKIPGAKILSIFTRFDDAHHDAVVALATADIQRFDSSDEDGDEDGEEENDYEDFIDNAGDLPVLLRMAGLDALADDVMEGEAQISTLLRVLVELFIHRRVPYLPLSFSPRIDMASLLNLLTEDPANMPANVLFGVRQFAESLPDDLELMGVVNVCGSDVGEYVAVVGAETHFGSLIGYFTLARSPGNVDIGRFME